MEPMKQCPSCGKYVAADKTYCMNCGTTLGIRCPDCRKVVPVGSKACTGCGHSFVVRKKRRMPTILPKIRKHAKPIFGVLLLLTALVTVILAAVPSVSFTLTETVRKEEVVTGYSASGFTLIRFLIGAHPSSVMSLMEHTAFKEIATGLRFSLYGVGLGWLILLVGVALSFCLFIPNYKRMTRLTATRMLPLAGVTVFGGTLAAALSFVVRSLLVSASALAWPAPSADETAEAAAEVAAYVAPYVIRTGVPLAMGIILLVVEGFYLTLYISDFRKAVAEGETGERSLGTILKTPFVALSRLIRKWIRKGKKPGKNADERTVVCTGRFTSYLILFGVALVFTQALLSKVSHIFFWFVLTLPLILLGYTLVARAALQVSMLSESTTTEKNTPYTYEFRIDNRSVLAFPFIEAEVSVPQSNSVRTSVRTVRMAMAPLSSYHMKNTVRFRFRGTYDIGVRCFYVYDFFRLFRVQVPVENMTTVYVLPRRLPLDDTLAQSVSDSTARTVRSPLVVDKLEVSDIREYRAGDSLKSIHWKLSSKSETFIVKDYNTGTSNQTVIFCDLAAHFPDEPPQKKTTEGEEPVGEGTDGKKDKKKKKSRKQRRAEQKAMQDRQAKNRRRKTAETEDTHAISDEALRQRIDDRATAVRTLTGSDGTEPNPEESAAQSAGTAAKEAEAHNVHELAVPAFYEDMNEYLADGVVELTIANVLAELNQGHETLLIWFDRRSDAGVFAFSLRGADEFERIFNLFGTAPLCDSSKSVASLTAMVGDTESAKQLFVVSAMDQDMLSSLSNLPGVSDAVGFGSAEVLLYNPEERFRYAHERSLYLEGCREQLAASGLDLMICHTQNAQPAQGGDPA